MAKGLSIAGHPLHSLLTDFPLVLFVTSILWDVLYLAGGNMMWWNFSLWSIGIGLLMVVPTAVSGAIDYFAIPPGHSAVPIARAHFGANLCMAASFFVSWLFFLANPAATQVLVPAFLFSLLGFEILLVSGWLGGTLVYKYGVGQPALPEHEEMPLPARPPAEEYRR